MATLDWSQCPAAVEGVAEKTVFENLGASSSIDEITEVFE